MIQKIYPHEVFQRWQADADLKVIDVRTVEEFREVRAQGVINIPLDIISAEKLQEEGIDKNQTVYLICRSGARSMRAAEKLEAEGFQDLYNIEGGTIGWVEAKLPHDVGEG